MDCSRLCLTVLGQTGLYWILLGCTVLRLALLGSIELFWAVMGKTGLIWGFYGFWSKDESGTKCLSKGYTSCDKISQG